MAADDGAALYQDMPKGFRFCPTDEELVGHYLRHKLLEDDPSIHDTMPEIDVCKYEPWQLPAFSPIKSDDPEWFFFSSCDYKYSNSPRFNRTTSLGYWKVTGRDRKIRDRFTDNVIGTKKTLVFYQAHAPRVKTNWVIHEYHDEILPPNQRTYVVCRLMKKHDDKEKEKSDEQLVSDENEPNNHMDSEYENQANMWMTPPEVAHYFSDMDSATHQALPASNEFAGSMNQTWHEANSTVDESESEGFNFESFLQFPPSN